MPLERRVQPSRTYQRKCHGTRQHPYRLPTRLADLRREGVTLELSTSGPDVPVRVPFEQLALKRENGGCACECATYDEPMQTDDVDTETLPRDQTEETQRLSSEQRSQTSANHNMWQTDYSTLRSEVPRSSHITPNSERHDDNVTPNPSTANAEDTSLTSELTSIIPNVVPMNSSGLSQYQCSVFNSDDTDTLINNDRSEDGLPSMGIQETDAKYPTVTHRRLMLVTAAPSAHARLVANRVIKHARDNKIPDLFSLWCPDCKRLPVLPVTGQCGHTRCTKCIQEYGACPCGVQAPKHLHVNTLVQSLIKKMSPKEPYKRDLRAASGEGELTRRARKQAQSLLPVSGVISSRRHSEPIQRSRRLRTSPHSAPNVLVSIQDRFELARRLASSGQNLEAAPHLARVAATPNSLARVARALLAQTIAAVSRGQDPRRLTRGLYRAVRAQSASAWLDARELECVLCYRAYIAPVTTPCGHTYCRTCIERSMDYRKSCALCQRPLDDFHLATTRETVFVCAALEAIDALSRPPPPDPDVIPIFVCTVAYPAIPCPLFIFDPRYWLMIRRVLESGSRKFGMVAYERDRSYSDYGTVLEVCDCVHLEDGRSILSTVGVSRFRVIERDVRDGCDVARIQPLTDITPTEELVIWELRIMATQISYKALLWLNSMSRAVRCEIEAAFGRLPRFDHQDWWDSPDGPAWLWWLIAILPLRSEIKILILSTKNLLKRMMAVSRTLDAIDQVAMSTTASTDCELRSALTNTEEWFERSA